MMLDSLKRTSAALVSLRKFQLRAPIDNANELYAAARVIIKPIIQEFNQHPVLTYQRFRSYLDGFDVEYRHIRCCSIMLVVAKAHHYSDTTLAPVLAALIAAQRIEQFKAQHANKNLRLPNWLQVKPKSTFNSNRDFFLYVMQTAGLDTQKQAPKPVKTNPGFNLETELLIASTLAQGFSDSPNSEFIELDCLSKLSTKSPGLEHSISPLLSPSSAFWARIVLQHQATLGFLLYATQAGLKLAFKTAEQDIRVDTKPYHLLYDSVIGKSQVSFKIWLKALVSYHQHHPDCEKDTAIPEYPIQRPPNDLLNIVHALHKPTTEPASIAALISNSNFFSKTLQRSAQQLNRMSLPVHDVKQSILTHGMERVGIILTEQVLWSRLTRASFPLKRQYEHLVELHRFVSASVAHSCGIGLPQQASLCATLQLSFLFTHAPLRLMTGWHDTQPDDALPATLFPNLDPELPLNSALILAKAWHQPSDIVKPLRYFHAGIKDKVITANIAVLKLSLILTRTWLSGAEISDSQWQALSKRYAQLKLSDQNLINIRNSAAEIIFCPLP